MAKPEVFPVTERIWCVRRRSYLTCSYFVLTEQGVVLVDAGMDSSGQDMTYGLEKAGKSLRDVRAILLTHWHNDHAAGASVLQKATGVPVYCHADELPALTRESAKTDWRGKLADAIPEWGLLVLFKGLLGEAIPCAVGNLTPVTEGTTLCGEFTVLAAPGHTPGSVCYLWGPEKALFGGDAFAVVKGQLRFMSRPVTPDQPRARLSMVHAFTCGAEILCPGHRMPLTQGVQSQCADLVTRLEAHCPWPLWG